MTAQVRAMALTLLDDSVGIPVIHQKGLIYCVTCPPSSALMRSEEPVEGDAAMPPSVKGKQVTKEKKDKITSQFVLMFTLTLILSRHHLMEHFDKRFKNSAKNQPLLAPLYHQINAKMLWQSIRLQGKQSFYFSEIELIYRNVWSEERKWMVGYFLAGSRYISNMAI